MVPGGLGFGALERALRFFGKHFDIRIGLRKAN